MRKRYSVALLPLFEKNRHHTDLPQPSATTYTAAPFIVREGSSALRSRPISEKAPSAMSLPHQKGFMCLIRRIFLLSFCS
jgi:hypothetical protein